MTRAAGPSRRKLSSTTRPAQPHGDHHGTPGRPTFERRTRSAPHGRSRLRARTARMQAVVKAADDKTVADVLAGASPASCATGSTASISRAEDRYAGLSRTSPVPTRHSANTRRHPRPSPRSNVEDLTLPVVLGFMRAPYSGRMVDLVKLRRICIACRHSTDARRGEAFDHRHAQGADHGHDMTTLADVRGTETREVAAGAFFLDMAQPMARAALLSEPRAHDGFVGWGVLDDTLTLTQAASALPHLQDAAPCGEFPAEGGGSNRGPGPSGQGPAPEGAPLKLLIPRSSATAAAPAPGARWRRRPRGE